MRPYWIATGLAVAGALGLCTPAPGATLCEQLDHVVHEAATEFAALQTGVVNDDESANVSYKVYGAPECVVTYDTVYKCTWEMGTPAAALIEADKLAQLVAACYRDVPYRENRAAPLTARYVFKLRDATVSVGVYERKALFFLRIKR